MNHMDTLFSNVTVVTMDEELRVLFSAFVGITEGKISYISKKAPEEQPAQIINGEGMVLMPGLINCHTPLPMGICWVGSEPKCPFKSHAKRRHMEKRRRLCESGDRERSKHSHKPGNT